MDNYDSFSILKQLSFVRSGGSQEELRCANIIKEECEKLQADVVLESFKVDGYKQIKSLLTFSCPNLEIECVTVGMSGSTPLEGLEGAFCYVNSLEDAQINDVEDKICLIHSKLVNYKLYKKLVEKKAKALILCCGNVYEDNDNVDLDPYMYRSRHYENGKIPAVCIRMKDADKILNLMPKTAKVVSIEEEFQADSHNVVATIYGDEYINEVIAFTAHYDSVTYSNGAYDNASGAASLLQLLAYFKKNKSKRTLKFIWCGSEEMGLLGSKAYVLEHKNELKNYKLCINIDMIGATIGRDIACVTGDVALKNYIKYISYEVGFPINSRQGVYSSDSTPFADNGITAVSFARLAPEGGAKIHSKLDILDNLSQENYYKTINFISLFASKMVNSVAFPVTEAMPEKMKEELDYYLGRKERPE